MTMTICWACNTPMDGDYLDDGAHPGCVDAPAPNLRVDPESLGPCAACGATTIRYGDTTTSTLCNHCHPTERTPCMSDRRNRPLIRCQVKGCIHVGPWDAAVPFCPGHIDDARSNWKAAVARATAPPEPTTPLDTARTLLGGTQPERNTP